MSKCLLEQQFGKKYGGENVVTYVEEMLYKCIRFDHIVDVFVFESLFSKCLSNFRKKFNI